MTVRLTIKTAYYKAQGLFTVRAYVTDERGIKSDFTCRTNEALDVASESAVGAIQNTYAREGLTIPRDILKTGKQSRILADNYSF